MHLDNKSSVPLYYQLYNRLQELIQEGIYHTGERIPSEADLCTQYAVSRVTVRKALDVLVQDGVLTRRHGLGTFVASPVFIESPYAQGSFAASCRQQGVTPSTRILFQAETPVKEPIAADMGMENGATIYELHRLRLANGMASIYEVDYISTVMRSYLESESLEDISLLAVIQQKTGLQYDGVEDMIDIAYATEQIAEALDCEVNAPLLCVYQKVFASCGSVMYINCQYIRSDRYKYVCSSVKKSQSTIEKSPKV